MENKEPSRYHLVIYRCFHDPNGELTKQDMNEKSPDAYRLEIDGKFAASMRRADYKNDDSFNGSYAGILEKLNSELAEDDTIILSFVNERQPF